MPKTRKQKEEAVSDLEASLKGANTVVFAGFNKLTVADERALRSDLRANGVSYKVAKKTLLARALATLGFADAPAMDGQVAVVYGADAVYPAKGIATFAKKHEGIMSILGGIFEGKLVDAKVMQTVAAIPPRETLLGMLANVLSAPMRGLAISLDALAKKNSETSAPGAAPTN